MSALLDVLATIEDSADALDNRGCVVRAERLMASHAAVAELIAATEEYRAALQAFANDGNPGNYLRHDEAEQRLDAALARVGAA